MEFTPNQVRVYENSGLSLYEEAELNRLESDYAELSQLIELFSYKDTSCHVKELKRKQRKIDKFYKPAIKEAKRVWKNTEKRVQYNSAKC